MHQPELVAWANFCAHAGIDRSLDPARGTRVGQSGLALAVARAGLGCGSVVAPLRLDLEAAGLQDAGAQQALVQKIAGLDAVAQVWLMRVDAAGTGVQTKEKAMRRSVEGVFDGVLVVEALHAAAAQAALDGLLAGELGSAAVADRQLFSACFQLDRRLAGLEDGV